MVKYGKRYYHINGGQTAVSSLDIERSPVLVGNRRQGGAIATKLVPTWIRPGLSVFNPGSPGSSHPAPNDQAVEGLDRQLTNCRPCHPGLVKCKDTL
jgi:hypothetical protein